MRTERVLGVIPARLGSERLPRKPLQRLAGRPLIEWVWRRADWFEAIDRLVVATDSEEVATVCRSLGAQVEMTGLHHRSGTERVAEVAARREYAGYDVVVNIQGDEPFIAEEQVAKAVEMVRSGFDIGTVAAPVRMLEVWRDPGVVKIARAADGRALYFSRAPIPFRRDGEPPREDLEGPDFLRHVGVYACSRDALMKWVALPESELERIEKLEQLRPLLAGMKIGVALVNEAYGGIDTLEDLKVAERLFQTRQSAGG